MSSGQWYYDKSTVISYWRLDLPKKGWAWTYKLGFKWSWGVSIRSGIGQGTALEGLTKGWAETKKEAMEEAEAVLDLIDEY